MRTEDYMRQIDEKSNDPKGLFKVINNALHKYQNNPMPPNKSENELVDEFITYFDEKINKIRLHLDSSENETYNPNEEIKKHDTELQNFKELSMDDVHNLLKIHLINIVNLIQYRLNCSKSALKIFYP